MSEVQCPRCGNSVEALQPLDAALAKKIREGGSVEALPSQVCDACFTQLAGGIARGSVLLAREKAREQKKLMLWRSRVNLIKKARSLMNEKMFSDAAVAYEKYLKVLEIVFDSEPGGLTPEAFKDSARTQELTVVASVYWDLLRIYDTSSNYGDRQIAAAQKLAQFLKFTPIYPDIIRKAEAFQKTAKNPGVIKSFLKQSDSNKGRCFIATAAFASPSAPIVLELSDFRDRVLMHSTLGRAFIRLYYRHSPPIAFFLDKHPRLKPLFRVILKVFAALCACIA